MLNTLRDNLKNRSWPKWILILVAVSMTLYLADAFFRGGSGSGGDAAAGNWAAKIDGDAISRDVYVRRAKRIDQTYRNLFGTNYADLRSQVRVGTQAMREILEEQIILRDAQRLGLSVTDDELIQRIRSTPELADANGSFIGKQEYETRLNRFYPGGVAAFEREMADQLLIDRWTDLVSQAVTVNDGDLEALYRERNEKTAVDFVVVRSADQALSTEITDAELEEWYNAHQDDYTREEGKRIRLLTIERQSEAAAGGEIAEEEIVAAYDANQSRYTHPEQRRARHILFRVEPEATDEEKNRIRQLAEQTIARVTDGEDFALLAGELSEDTFSGQRGGDLDWFGRGQMVPPFEEAAFATPAGQLAPLTETDFGFHIIEVTGARDAGTLPLDEVREQLLSELRVSRSEELMLGEAQRIRDKIDSPESFSAVAAEEGLEIDARFVNADEGLREIAASTEFSTTVLELEPGEISRPLRVGRGMAVVVVDEIVPASVAPLADVEQKLRTDVLNHRSREAAMSSGRDALDGREDFDEAAAALGAAVEDSGDLSPGQVLPGSGGISPELQRVLFGDAVDIGDRGVAEVPAGAVIYEVTRREPFDPVEFEAAKEDLRTELVQQRKLSMRRSMVDQLSRQADIVINDEMVQRLDGGA